MSDSQGDTVALPLRCVWLSGALPAITQEELDKLAQECREAAKELRK